MPANTPLNRIYRFGEYRLLKDERMLLRGDERIALAPKAFDLLLVLVENAGRLIRKETLMREVWADSFVEEGNLNHAVSALRKALGNDAIQTIPWRGYRFAVAVKITEDIKEPPCSYQTTHLPRLPIAPIGREKEIAAIKKFRLLLAHTAC